MSARRDIAATAALAFALRLAVALALPTPPTWDGTLYERAAQGLAAGLGYSCFMFGPAADPTYPTAYYPVGFPAYLSAFYAVLGAGVFARALAGALAGAAMTAATYSLAARLTSTFGARLAALCVALTPGLVLSAGTPMTETLWGALLALCVAVLAADPAPSRARAVGLGALFAAAAFVRPQALILAPLLPLIPAGPLRLRAARALATTLVVALCVTPWALRNCASLDGCALVSTNGAGNFAIGAVPRADGRYLTLTGADGCALVRGEAARERCWRKVARAAIARDPWRWVRLAVPKVEHTWAYEAFPAGYLAAARPDRVDAAAEARIRAALTACWRALLALCLVALLPTHARRRLGAAGALCLATLAAITLTHAVFFGGDRYHLPLVPFVAALAMRAGVDGPRWRRRAWRWTESSAAERKNAPDIQR